MLTWLYFLLLPFVILSCVLYQLMDEKWEKISKKGVSLPVNALHITGMILAFIAAIVFVIGAIVGLSGRLDPSTLILYGVLICEVWCAVGLYVSHVAYQNAQKQQKETRRFHSE